MIIDSLYLCADNPGAEILVGGGINRLAVFNVTVPQRCVGATIFLCGGGGGGGAGDILSNFGGGGGGSGEFVGNLKVPLLPGDALTVNLGFGGLGGTSGGDGLPGCYSSIHTSRRLAWGAHQNASDLATILNKPDVTAVIAFACGGGMGYAGTAVKEGRGGAGCHDVASVGTAGVAGLTTANIASWTVYDGGAVNAGDDAYCLSHSYPDGSFKFAAGGLAGHNSAVNPGRVGMYPVLSGIDGSGFPTYQYYPWGMPLSARRANIGGAGKNFYHGLGGPGFYNSVSYGARLQIINGQAQTGFGGGGGVGGFPGSIGKQGGDGACLIIWEYEA